MEKLNKIRYLYEKDNSLPIRSIYIFRYFIDIWLQTPSPEKMNFDFWILYKPLTHKVNEIYVVHINFKAVSFVLI